MVLQKGKNMQVNPKDLKGLDFNKAEYEYFLENCNFTDRQKEILNLRRRGMSIIEISMYEGEYLPTSPSTVDREIRKIKNKILKLL